MEISTNRGLGHDFAMGIGFLPVKEVFGENEPGLEAPAFPVFTTTSYVGFASDMEEKVWGTRPERKIEGMELDNAAFKLLYDYLLFGNEKAGKDSGEISDKLMEVAQAYLSGGIEAVIKDFSGQKRESLAFINRLTSALSEKYRGKIEQYRFKISSKTKTSLSQRRGKYYKALRFLLYA